MPQLAMGAVSAIKAGFGALTGAGGTAAAAGGAKSLLGASQFASGLKLLSGIGSGLAGMAQSRNEAAQVELQAGQEQIKQESRTAAARRQLAAVMGENRTSFAAAGIDLTQGIAAQDAATQRQRSDDEISIDRRESDFQRELLRLRARNTRRAGTGRMFGGLVSGLGEYASASADLRTVG